MQSQEAGKASLAPEQDHRKDSALPTEASQLLWHASWLVCFALFCFIFLHWFLELWVFIEKYGHFYLPQEFPIAHGDRDHRAATCNLSAKEDILPFLKVLTETMP